VRQKQTFSLLREADALQLAEIALVDPR